MYTVEFYEDKNGVSEVRDYFMKLAKEAETDKNARINKNKIFSYVRALEEYGTRIGNPIVKHIDGNLWELRPLNNRIFFFYWKDNKFVLVHYYIKKSQKAPKKVIKKAMSNIKDCIERNGDEMFNDDKIVSSEEREQINFQVSLIGKMIEAREKKGLSQRDLAELSGVKQPAIARLESMKSTPQIDTLLKILAPLGYTLSIIPIENKR